MSIGIETNLSLICSAFNISYTRITNEYSGMTISQIMEQEALQGNNFAAQFDEELLSDPKKLIQFIQLNQPENKYAILSNMNEDDLTEMLPLLENEDMALGLNFFTQDKLMELIKELPSEQSAKLSLQLFSPEHLMSFMPKEALDKVLNTTMLKEMRNDEIECVSTLPPEIIAQMIEAVTGEVPEGVKGVDLAGNVSFDQTQLMKQVKGFNKDEFQESLLAIPPRHKQIFMLEMTNKNQKIWNLFDSSYYSDIIGSQKKKEDIVAASTVIDHENMVKMSGSLPKELLSVVLTQIDSVAFAEVLQKNFKDVLGELVVS